MRYVLLAIGIGVYQGIYTIGEVLLGIGVRRRVARYMCIREGLLGTWGRVAIYVYIGFRNCDRCC